MKECNEMYTNVMTFNEKCNGKCNGTRNEKCNEMEWNVMKCNEMNKL